MTASWLCRQKWEWDWSFLAEKSERIRSADDRRITGELIGHGRKPSMAYPAAVRLPAARLLQMPFRRLLFRLYPASQLFVTHTVGDEHHAFVVIHHRYFNYRKSSRISRRTSAPIFSLICLTMPSMASFSTMR